MRWARDEVGEQDRRLTGVYQEATHSLVSVSPAAGIQGGDAGTEGWRFRCGGAALVIRSAGVRSREGLQGDDKHKCTLSAGMALFLRLWRTLQHPGNVDLDVVQTTWE